MPYSLDGIGAVRQEEGATVCFCDSASHSHPKAVTSLSAGIMSNLSFDLQNLIYCSACSGELYTYLLSKIF